MSLTTIEANVVKKTPDMKLGVTIKSEQGALVVSKVSPESPFYGLLPVGYGVVDINGTFNLKTVFEAVAVLKEAYPYVSITATSLALPACAQRLPIVMKDSRASKLSPPIRFEAFRDNLVRISHVNSTGVFAPKRRSRHFYQWPSCGQSIGCCQRREAYKNGYF
jgi:hypothetical protein